MDARTSAILVVDDDADTCSNLSDLFLDVGYEVEAVGCGEAALERARVQAYVVGLLDFRMPGMDGLTLCRHLKQMQPCMVTLIVSAYANGLHDEALAAGAWRVVTKPIDFRGLLVLVEQARAVVN